MSDGDQAKHEGPGVEWLPVLVAAVVVPVLWFALGEGGDAATAAMPGWAAVLFALGGREAVVGVFAVAGWLWLCVALSMRWPNVGATLLMGSGAAGLVVALRASWGLLGGAWGWAAPGLVGLIGWVILLLAALSLPTVRLRKVTSGAVLVGGPVGAAALAASHARWGYLALSVAILAFVLWVLSAPRTVK